MGERESESAVRRGFRLTPAYDEAALFFIAVTCMLLLVGPSGLWRDLGPLMSRPSETQMVVFFGLVGVVGAAGLSIYHVFTPRPKHMFEKSLLAAFVLASNGTAGVVSGVQVLRTATYSTAVFPLANLVFAVLLIYQLAVADASAIADDNAYVPGLIVGLLVLFALFVACIVIWHLSWAMTFSVCAGYSTLASRVFTRLEYLWTMR